MTLDGLDRLPDGTGVRFQHPSGFEYTATVEDAQILDPNGQPRTPSSAAREVDKRLQPDDCHYSTNGWQKWEWDTGNCWQPIDTVQ